MMALPNKTREDALKELLSPITWDWSSSIGHRKAVVVERRDAVRAAYPFLTDDEKKLANEWLVQESHDGLWD